MGMPSRQEEGHELLGAVNCGCPELRLICRYPLAMSGPVTVGSVVGMKMPSAV